MGCFKAAMIRSVGIPKNLYQRNVSTKPNSATKQPLKGA
jgi:hypothetical protein